MPSSPLLNIPLHFGKLASQLEQSYYTGADNHCSENIKGQGLQNPKSSGTREQGTGTKMDQTKIRAEGDEV